MGKQEQFDDDGPKIFDDPPPPWTGVPVERDPATGKLLRGHPGGRGDKGRAARPRHLQLLIAAAVLLVIGAATVIVILATGPDGGNETAQRPTSTSTGTGSGATTDSDPGPDEQPPADTGPREVVVETTFTAAESAPGVPPGGNGFPEVGDVQTTTWILTGPCDGQGPCSVEECVDETTCRPESTFTPTGSGYTGTVESSFFGRPWPECGSVRTVYEFTVSQVGDTTEIAGTTTQTSGAVLGQNGTEFCSITIYETSFASA